MLAVLLVGAVMARLDMSGGSGIQPDRDVAVHIPARRQAVVELAGGAAGVVVAASAGRRAQRSRPPHVLPGPRRLWCAIES